MNRWAKRIKLSNWKLLVAILRKTFLANYPKRLSIEFIRASETWRKFKKKKIEMAGEVYLGSVNN